MRSLQVIGILACCMAVFVGVVTFLTIQGVPLLLAFLGVYLAAVCFMLGMQRRARESREYAEFERRRSGLPMFRDPSRDPAGDSAHGSGDRHQHPGLHEQFRA